MNLVQFNPRVIPTGKRKVNIDAVNFDTTNNVIVSAILDHFFKTVPKEARKELYADMKRRIENGTNGAKSERKAEVEKSTAA